MAIRVDLLDRKTTSKSAVANFSSLFDTEILSFVSTNIFTNLADDWTFSLTDFNKVKVNRATVVVPKKSQSHQRESK